VFSLIPFSFLCLLLSSGSTPLTGAKGDFYDTILPVVVKRKMAKIMAERRTSSVSFKPTALREIVESRAVEQARKPRLRRVNF
jgi:hypothetical protein